MTAELVPIAAPAPPVISNADMRGLYEVAKALAASGMFKDIRQAEQAFAKILIGRDLGLSPTQAMMGIHLIEGKPELSANLQAAFVKQTPGYDFRVIEHTDEVCEIAFFRDGEQIGTSRFSMDNAKRAGLAGRDNWKSYPANMLYARAMSNGVAFHCPEVTGGIRTYVDGEIGGDERPPQLPDAEVVEHQPGPDKETVDHLEAGCRELVERGAWDSKLLSRSLIAAGARTTESVRAAIASLTVEQADELRESLDVLLDKAREDDDENAAPVDEPVAE